MRPRSMYIPWASFYFIHWNVLLSRLACVGFPGIEDFLFCWRSFCVDDSFLGYLCRLKAVFMDSPFGVSGTYLMCFFHWNHLSHNGDTLLIEIFTFIEISLFVNLFLNENTFASFVFLAINHEHVTIYFIDKKEPAQNLRSALEEKARKQQPGQGKPKRKMKPGQAKTISDLPQLSAWG